MTRNKTQYSILILLALAALVFAGAPLLAGEEGEHHEIVIESFHEEHSCEGDDCPRIQRKIFISEDGTRTELDGEDMKWVHIGGHHDMAFGKRGFLGVQFSELTPELREHFGVPAEAGILISKVVEDSPAQRAGIQVGDILTRVDESDIASGRDLMKVVGHAEEGATVNLEIWRADRVQVVAATLEAREPKIEMHKINFQGHEGMTAGRHKVVEIHCEDGAEGDCNIHHAEAMHLDFEEHCGEGEECEVNVNCDGDSCTCTVNGAEVDCPDHLGD